MPRYTELFLSAVSNVFAVFANGRLSRVGLFVFDKRQFISLPLGEGGPLAVDEALFDSALFFKPHPSGFACHLPQGEG